MTCTMDSAGNLGMWVVGGVQLKTPASSMESDLKAQIGKVSGVRFSRNLFLMWDRSSKKMHDSSWQRGWLAARTKVTAMTRNLQKSNRQRSFHHQIYTISQTFNVLSSNRFLSPWQQRIMTQKKVTNWWIWHRQPKRCDKLQSRVSSICLMAMLWRVSEPLAIWQMVPVIKTDKSPPDSLHDR